MEEKPPITDQADEEGGWRRRFKGRVELLRHHEDQIEVVVQIYSLPRPPDSKLSHTPLTGEEQVLFLSTVDPSVRLLLRVVAARAAAAASIATVTVEARSNRLPALHEPGRLDIQLSADGQRFISRTPTPMGYTFSNVPIAALGSLRIELTLTLAH
jgi:hypothetical protein